MPLPSNAQVAPLSVALGTPQINLANYTVDPTKIQQSLSGGINLGNQLTDAIILRPRQVDAAGALADAQQQEYLNANQAAVADRSNIPLRAANEAMNIPLRGQVEQTAAQDQITKNQTAGVADQIKYHLINTPSFQADMQTALDKANNSLASNATRQAALDKSAAVNVAPVIEAQRSADEVAAAKGKTAAAVANTFATQENDYNAGLSAAKAAAEQARANAAQATIAAQTFDNPNIQKQAVLGNRSAVALQAYQQTLNLARTLAMGGGSGIPLSQDAMNNIVKTASEKGIDVSDGMLGTKPIAEISRLLTERVNAEQGKDVLTQANSVSDDAVKSLNAFQAVKQILPAASTGGLESLPGMGAFNNILAGWGVPSAQANQELTAFQKGLVADATTEGGGHLRSGMFTGDYNSFQAAFPSLNQSMPVNKDLVATGIAVNTRLAQKGNFFDTLVPKVSANGAQQLWNQYLATNPLYDPSAPTGTIKFNNTSLTPQQYVEAIQNPDLAKQNLAKVALAQAAVPGAAKLPIYNPVNPSSAPFVMDNGKVVANPVYWTPIENAHNSVVPARPANTGPMIQSYMDSIGKTLGTP